MKLTEESDCECAECAPKLHEGPRCKTCGFSVTYCEGMHCLQCDYYREEDGNIYPVRCCPCSND